MKKNPSLIISAGKGCFTYCKGCYQFFGKGLISTREIFDFVEKYKKEFNLQQITLAGGDPLTRIDIIKMINMLNDIGLEINIDTVGKTLISDSAIVFNDIGIAKKIDVNDLKNKISTIGIPLDGYNDEQLNCFRKEITISEIEKILKILDDNGFDICVNTVVNKFNIENLFQIYDIIKKYKNIRHWQLFQYTPIGKLGYKNRKLYEVDDDKYYCCIEKLIKSIDENSILIEGKSNSYRKLNYILVNSDGFVWQPLYNISTDEFKDEDSNDDKIIIGHINDNDIIEKIKNHLNKIKINVKENDQKLIRG